MNYYARALLNRIAAFARPKPTYVPVTVEEVLSKVQSRDVVERFNDFYYTSGTQGNLTWRGSPMIKNPCDLWVMVEALQDLRPAIILETGTHHGASAIFFSDMARLLSVNCKVITIDVNPKWKEDPAKHGITSLVGFSTDTAIVEKAHTEVERALHANPGHVMVLLDSDHSEANVSRELLYYAPLVTKGSLLVVEDTNVNGHPSFPAHGPGPFEAVEKFLATSNDFEVDLSCQRFLVTFNPRGWLRRKT
jgi:cephalosporin hydroxylase